MLIERPGSVAKRPTKNIVIAAGVLVLVAYLAGFLPAYAKQKRLESSLRQASAENRGAQLRDLAALAYLQSSQKNYGLAAGTSTRFFERTREFANQAPDSGNKKALEDLLAVRDKIASELAKGDPAAQNDLEALYLKTRDSTVTPSPSTVPH